MAYTTRFSFFGQCQMLNILSLGILLNTHASKATIVSTAPRDVELYSDLVLPAKVLCGSC